MDHKCTVELKGNILDTLKLTSVLDEINDSGCVCKIKDLKIAESREEKSYARIKIRCENKNNLDNLINKIKKHGAAPVKILSKTIELQGHIIDSLTLSKVLDIIFSSNARCEIQEIKIGVEKKDFSYARIKIYATDVKIMESLIEKIVKQGAVVVD